MKEAGPKNIYWFTLCEVVDQRKLAYGEMKSKMVARERGPWEGQGGIFWFFSDRLKFSDRLEMFCILIGDGLHGVYAFHQNSKNCSLFKTYTFQLYGNFTLKKKKTNKTTIHKKHKKSVVHLSQARHFARSEEMAKCLTDKDPDLQEL